MDDTIEESRTTRQPRYETVSVNESTVAPLTADEVMRVRARLDDDPPSGGNRFGWFLIGFVAALVAVVVAADVFFVISDRDNDGNLNVDVPAVDVDG